MGNNIGTGTTVTFSGWSGDVTGVRWNGIEVPIIDMSHMGTSAWKTFIAGDLKDGGTVEVDLLFADDAIVPLVGTTQTLTMKRAGQATNGKWAASCIFQSFSAVVPFEDRMTATATFKVSGEVTLGTGA